MDTADHQLAATQSTAEPGIENWVTIEPSKGLIKIDFRELWTYRDLFRFLVWRDILVRYKQTLLGGAWAVLQPLTAMVIFTVFFGRLAKMPSDGLPYPVFSYTALVLWSFFAQSVSQSANSLVANEKLVTKIYFPRLIVPAAPVLASLLDLVIACCLLLLLLPYYGIGLSANIWAVPIMVVVAVIAALGAGTWIAALNVKYRDFRYVVPFLIQTWMFMSPVVYPASMVPEKWRIFYGLNPMAGAIEGFRWALLETNVDPWPILAVSVASAAMILLFGVIYFQRTEEFFADLI
jgi:lipopolysaccharide transport system permease protein